MMPPIENHDITNERSNPGDLLSPKRLTIAVDFDGVIAEYEGWKGTGIVGRPRTDVVEVLLILRREGWKIIVHSTRGDAELRQYLLDHSIPFDEINCNSIYITGGTKPVATIYWDDRACRYSGDAYNDLNFIRHFRTWSGRP